MENYIVITGYISRIWKEIFGTLTRISQKNNLVKGQYTARWAGFRFCKVRHTGLVISMMGGRDYF